MPLDAERAQRHNRPMERLEEQIAHLIRICDDLSEIVARQDREIALLTRRVEMLMHREAERESDTGGALTFGNQPPPHY